MKKSILTVVFFIGLTTALSLCSCEKFLDEKAEKSMVIPKSLDDLQALLDASGHINLGMYPGLLEIATDDYYVPHATLINLTDFEQAIYVWEAKPLYGQSETNRYWKNGYLPVFVTNTVLDELEKMQDSNQMRANEIKGAALFLRAFSFFHMAQVFCAPYDINGSNDGLGLPLRLTSDFAVKSARATLQQTYDRILEDLHTAADLLPAHAAYRTRPDKTAAFSMLARVYLAMADYGNAWDSANQALWSDPPLIDYNDVDVTTNQPFAPLNEETLFFAHSNGTPMLNPTRAIIDSELYKDYETGDLRKQAFFSDKGEGQYGFKGSYMGNSGNGFFIGLTTGELLLVRAECSARRGDHKGALDDLNRLLSHRWQNGGFLPVSIEDAEDVLAVILRERRKELLFRGVRWSDLRRLNNEQRFAKTLIRTISEGGQIRTYTLPPNDIRFTFLIPQDIIGITGMEQNPR